MMKFSLTWLQMKNILSTKKLLLQYIENTDDYVLLSFDGPMFYETVLVKNTSECTEFETTYKASANKNIVPIDNDGKPFNRAESRPLDMVTCFTTCGDTSTVVGGGTRLEWDFSNSNNEVSAPEGYKRKRIDITFKDAIRIKEGAAYYFNKIKGSYFDFYVIHPNPAVPILSHYVIKHPMQGDVPMGDELNTEAASSEIPAGLIIRLEVTVPSSDIISNGVIEMEIYRRNTV